jgi:Beta xylosidase C-terminal Concanavalin A-like domain
MKDLNDAAFISLFKEASQKCFGHPLSEPLSETESRHLASQIFEATGLVIGAKSLKNYSIYVAGNAEVKTENPSVATLDTLARYVANAPYISEVQRKDNEGNYPYWFQYKSSVTIPAPERKNRSSNNSVFSTIRIIAVIAVVILIVAGAIIMIGVYKKTSNAFFKDAFRTVNENALTSHGWLIRNKDTTWWKQRYQRPGQLTLYTLRGDNWADSANTPAIKNLLMRKLTSDCFVAELHLDDFMPLKNWQQAGILLLEDSTLKSKSLRLSIAYNDYFGGYKKPNEIIIQAISSDSTDLSKPEEIVHQPILTFEAGQASLVSRNMSRSALKIVKNGDHFRFLYSTGIHDNFAYKEVLSKDLNIKPKYIAIFALQGFVDKPLAIPAHIRFFSIMDTPCN